MKTYIIEKVESEKDINSLEELEEALSNDFLEASFEYDGFSYAIYWIDGIDYRVTITDEIEIDIDQEEEFDEMIELIGKYLKIS